MDGSHGGLLVVERGLLNQPSQECLCHLIGGDAGATIRAHQVAEWVVLCRPLACQAAEQ